jgi:hypothetical protein
MNNTNPSVVFRKPSSTPSGFFGSGIENIVELENFMTEEEVEFLDKAARSITVWDVTQSHVNENGTVVYDAGFWKDRVASRPSLDKNDPRIGVIIENLVGRLKPIIEDFFNVKAQPTGQTIVKWLPGQLQHPHADKELHYGPDAGTPNDFPHYDIASLFYINDDYLGGELYFPNQGIQFKPKRGAAYFFPGDMNYVHGVTEVRESLRYTCPFFWEILEHTGEVKPDFTKEYFRIFPEDSTVASWSSKDGILGETSAR